MPPLVLLLCAYDCPLSKFLLHGFGKFSDFLHSQPFFGNVRCELSPNLL